LTRPSSFHHAVSSFHLADHEVEGKAGDRSGKAPWTHPARKSATALVLSRRGKAVRSCFRCTPCPRYTATNKATGNPVNVRVAHHFVVRGGLIVRFEQFVDTALVRDAMTD
jgi:hypothetical protein